MIAACILSVIPLSDTGVATGGSAIKAVEVLMEHGVPEQRIIFINLVWTLSAPRTNQVNTSPGRSSRGPESFLWPLSISKSGERQPLSPQIRVSEGGV